MGGCLECDGSTVWDEQVGSSICTTCGTLSDPTQSVLSSHVESNDNSGRDYDLLWNPTTTLKSVVRGHTGWDLVGQGKEARNSRDTYAMHQFIHSVCNAVSAPGLNPRACTLFNQAMSAGSYRWGRRAKLIAGAAVAIALRQSNRPDSLHDIAFLVDEQPQPLNRAFVTTIKLLGLDVRSADPTQYLPTLQVHLTTLLRPNASDGPSTLPSALIEELSSLSLPSAIRSATALSNFLARLPSHPLFALPNPPTACALLILGLEGESGTSLPHLAVLCKSLAMRFGLAGGVVNLRYRMCYELVEQWIQDVPWLKAQEGTKNSRARRKFSRRVTVAKGLKDIVQFREELWKKRMEDQGRPRLSLETDEDENAVDEGRAGPAPSDRNSVFEGEDGAPSRPRKKRKTQSKPLDDASHFLLDPLSAPLPAYIASPRPHSPSRTPPPLIHPLPLTSYLLSTSPTAIPAGTMPTRLQLLSAQRGGEAEVEDDELFSESEWQGVVRDEDEVETLRGIFEWEPESQSDKENEGNQSVSGSCDGKWTQPSEDRDHREVNMKSLRHVEVRKTGTRRVDMTALARILSDPADPECGKEDDYQDDTFMGASGFDADDQSTCASLLSFNTDAEEIEAWRPVSPHDAYGEAGAGLYDEEY